MAVPVVRRCFGILALMMVFSCRAILFHAERSQRSKRRVTKDSSADLLGLARDSAIVGGVRAQFSR
jgi:hypothetical protein